MYSQLTFSACVQKPFSLFIATGSHSNTQDQSLLKIISSVTTLSMFLIVPVFVSLFYTATYCLQTNCLSLFLILLFSIFPFVQILELFPYLVTLLLSCRKSDPFQENDKFSGFPQVWILSLRPSQHFLSLVAPLIYSSFELFGQGQGLLRSGCLASFGVPNSVLSQ